LIKASLGNPDLPVEFCPFQMQYTVLSQKWVADLLVILTYPHGSSALLYSGEGLQCKTDRSFAKHSEKSVAREFLGIALFIPEYNDTNTAFHSSARDMHVIRKFFLRLPAHCMYCTVA